MCCIPEIILHSEVCDVICRFRTAGLGGYFVLLKSTLLRAPAAALISRLLSQDGKDISEAPTLCPGLTCSQKEESHTAEEPGAHGSIRNPGQLLAGGGPPGVSGVKC